MFVFDKTFLKYLTDNFFVPYRRTPSFLLEEKHFMRQNSYFLASLASPSNYLNLELKK
jgi:hypothetical protein